MTKRWFEVPNPTKLIEYGQDSSANGLAEKYYGDKTTGRVEKLEYCADELEAALREPIEENNNG